MGALNDHELRLGTREAEQCSCISRVVLHLSTIPSRRRASKQKHHTSRLERITSHAPHRRVIYLRGFPLSLSVVRWKATTLLNRQDKYSRAEHYITPPSSSLTSSSQSHHHLTSSHLSSIPTRRKWQTYTPPPQTISPSATPERGNPPSTHPPTPHPSPIPFPPSAFTTSTPPLRLPQVAPRSKMIPI